MISTQTSKRKHFYLQFSILYNMSFFRNFIENLFKEREKNDINQRCEDHHHLPENRFQNPIWQNNEENDAKYSNDYRPFANYDRNSTLQLFTNPFEIIQYFESRIDNMMKNMMQFRLDDDADFIFNVHSDQSLPDILRPSNRREYNLRDQFLKPNCTSSSNNDQSEMTIDTHLDGKYGFSLHSFELHVNAPFSHMTIVPNITMTRISTITDSAGNSETIIICQYDDNIHEIIAKRNKDNVETKVEHFANVNESDTWLGCNFEGTLLEESLWGWVPNPLQK